MQITVDINDDALREAMEKGVKSLSEETLTEMAKEALQAYMLDPKNIDDLVFWSRRNGYYNQNAEVRPEIMKMLMNSFSKEEIEEYRQKLFQVIDKHGDQLLVRTLAEIFSGMLMTESAKSDLSVQLWKIANEVNKQ
jgi:hypothetical protein